MPRLRRQFSEDYHKARALRSKDLRAVAAVANLRATVQEIFPGKTGANIGAKYEGCDKGNMRGRPIAGMERK